jgi:hypothetical protein
VFKKLKQILIVSALFYGWHLPFDMTSAMAQNVIAAERVTFEGPGGNVAAMRETTKITRVVVDEKGVVLTFDKGALPVTRGGSGWPDTCVPFENCTEPGIDMGALQYSVGFVLPVNGQLFGSAPIESWYERDHSGTGMITDQTTTCTNGVGQFQCNFYYDGRWPNLRQVRPAPGDEVGVFVLAGDARNGYVPLQERSNIVTFKLPAPGGSVTVDYAAGGGGSDPIATTLQAERAKYGATITSAQGAAILNATAWAHRGEGVSLLGKSGGSHCTQPNSGTAISCDYLIVNRGGTWFGQDVLVAAPADGEQPSAGGPAGSVTFPDNMQDMINSGARSVVAAVDPGGITPPPPPVDPGVGPQGPPGPKGDKGDPGDPANVDALTNEVNALRAEVDALKALRIPTGCKASVNIGIKIGVHCELTY